MTFHALDSIESILAAAARHGVSLSPDGATLDTMGLDFVVVHARDANGTRWIVRAPRRADVLANTQTEARILRAVRDAVPVAVPDWRITEEVIAYPRLDGTPAVTLDTGAPVWNVIDPAAPSPAFIDSMGAFLAALQRVASPELPARSLAEERAAIARAIAITTERLSPPEPVVARWNRFITDDRAWPTQVALSHGDLHPGHLLLDAEGRLAGVLDWTEARVGDPAIDFAMQFYCFKRPTLDAMVEAFARHGGTVWPAMIEHAIERAAVSPALAYDWAVDKNNAIALDYAKSAIAELA